MNKAAILENILIIQGKVFYIFWTGLNPMEGGSKEADLRILASNFQALKHIFSIRGALIKIFLSFYFYYDL